MLRSFWKADGSKIGKRRPLESWILDLGSRAEEKTNPRGNFFSSASQAAQNAKDRRFEAQELAKPYVRKVLEPRNLKNLMYVRFGSPGACKTLCT